MGPGRQVCARPEPSERPDRRAGPDMGLLEMAETTDGRAILDGHAGRHDHVRLDDHIAADDRVVAQEHRFGCHKRRSLLHDSRAQTPLHETFRHGEFRARIDAKDLFGVRQHDTRLQAVAMCKGDGVG